VKAAHDWNDARTKADLVLLQTADDQLTIETASELTAQRKLARLADGVGSIVTRLSRLVPPFFEHGEEADLPALHKAIEDLRRLHLTGGVA
jgi:hypothetical protein